MTSIDLVAGLDAFVSALGRLGSAIDAPRTEWTRDAAIQRFEFTFELAWKSIAWFARREGVECLSPRQSLRTALSLGWIEDDELWLTMLDDRALAAHTYNEAIAEEIFGRLPGYRGALAALIGRLVQLDAGAERD